MCTCFGLVARCAWGFESNEPCAFLIECWSECRRSTTKETTAMISVCGTSMVDSSPPAARLVLDAGEEGVEDSGSERDGTE